VDRDCREEAAFLHHIEDDLPTLREALEDPRNDLGLYRQSVVDGGSGGGF
jgi:hypothetical protein